MRWLLLWLALVVGPAYAIEPEERLADPALEQRARALSKELRCIVCQNQSIDDSDAAIAKDLRTVVRERLVAGESDATIRSYLVSRYGDFVLLRPRLDLATILLWSTPLLLLLGGAIWIAGRRRGDATDVPLTAEEERRLRELS